MKLLMENWRKYLNEAPKRKSADGIKKAIKDLTQQGGNTGGNPTGMKAVKRPLGDKDEDEISAPPGAPGGGSIGHLEESEGSNTDDEKYFQWLIPLREIGTQALKDKETFKRMGSGGYRIVFYPLSDPTFVIKAAKNKTGVENNKKEHEANRLFPNIFPRTFAHASNWHWIVSEKVKVLVASDNEGFDEMVEINFPRLRDYMYQNDFIRKTILKSFGDKPPGGQAVFFHATQALMYGGGTESSEFKTQFSKELSDIFVKHNASEDEKKAYDMMFRFAMKNEPIFFEIYKAYNELKLEPSDFGAGNIGVNEVGDLKILDASYFGD